MELLLLQARLCTVRCSPASVCLCPSATGLRARVGGYSLEDWEPPAWQTQEFQSPKLSVEGRGLEQCVRQLCPDTAVGTSPEGLGAADCSWSE